MKKIIGFILILVVPIVLISADSTMEVEQLSERLSVISGLGGNICIYRGDRALLLIDTGVKNGRDAITGILKKFTPLKIGIIVNTHYHRDHTGNTDFLAANKVAVMHKSCYDQIKDQLKNARINRFEKRYTFPKSEFEGVLELIHLGPAHTSGDSIVIFKDQKVIHTGDLFFHGMAPYIDVKNGADIKNWIRTINTIIERYPDYKVVPGHGKITDMKAFAKFRDYLSYLRSEVIAGIKAGKTVKECMASIDTSSYSHLKENRFMSMKNNIKWIYEVEKGTKK